MTTSVNEFIEYLEKLTPDIWIQDEKNLREKLEDIPFDLITKIPLVNSNALHNLVDGQLVRFRGMIQDMHNSEFYLENFETVNRNTGVISTRSGKYRDVSHVPENESMMAASPSVKSGQRHTVVIISLPGFNAWVETIENHKNDLQYLLNQPSTSQTTHANAKLKRSHDDFEDDGSSLESKMEVCNVQERTKRERKKSNDATENVKKLTLSPEHILNFPIPDVPSKSCLVKVYDDSDQLKLNEMIEVLGFLSVDPKLNDEVVSDKTALTDIEDDMDAETLTHNPPPSLVPRVHAIYIKRLDHCNPLVDKFVEGSTITNAVESREKLRLAFSEILLGDSLAAEYLICNLISCVYLRKDVLTLGQFSLNLSNIPSQKYEHFASEVYNILKELVTKSYYLPLTLENLNSMAFSPKKDYECNRLTSGLLQLSKNTHLFIDETKLQQGQLDSHGIKNITALGNAIKLQKVEYDFKYYQMEFDCDISVLILSEGKSMLPSDVHVPIVIDDSRLKIFNEIVEATTHYLKPDILNAIRMYITETQLIDYSIKEENQFVQDDFIEMRRNCEDGQAPTADDLHKLLVLGRLVSISRGHNTLNKECWDAAKTMEAERVKRLPKITRNVPSPV